MAYLTDWYFFKGNHFHLKGVVAGHQKLADGTNITTSRVETLVRQDNNLVAKTRSGTTYYLELAEMFLKDGYIEDTKDALKSFGFDEMIINEAGVLCEQKNAERLKMVDKLIGNNELLLFMKGEDTTAAYLVDYPDGLL